MGNGGGKAVGFNQKSSVLIGRSWHLDVAVLGSRKSLKVIAGFCTRSYIKSGFKETLQLP